MRIVSECFCVKVDSGLSMLRRKRLEKEQMWLSYWKIYVKEYEISCLVLKLKTLDVLWYKERKNSNCNGYVTVLVNLKKSFMLTLATNLRLEDDSSGLLTN